MIRTTQIVVTRVTEIANAPHFSGPVFLLGFHGRWVRAHIGFISKLNINTDDRSVFVGTCGYTSTLLVVHCRYCPVRQWPVLSW